MSALFNNKRCVICNRYICQIPKYRDAHAAFHIRKGEAAIVFADHKQFFVTTEKAEAATPAKDVTAVTAARQDEPRRQVEVNPAPRI